MERLNSAVASSGLRARARAKAASASSTRPSFWRVFPRLLWASERLGLRASARPSRPPEGGRRLLQPALFLERVPEVVVKGGAAGLGLDCLGDVADREAVPPGLGGDHAQEVVRVRVIGIGPEDLVVEAFRFLEAPRPVIGEGLVQLQEGAGQRDGPAHPLAGRAQALFFSSAIR